MPTTFSPEAQAGLQQVITEQLVREFTEHSWPEVSINRDNLEGAVEIRVRIFGDLHVVHRVDDRMHDCPGDQQAAYARVFDHVVRNIVNHIRRAPAQPRPARPAGITSGIALQQLNNTQELQQVALNRAAQGLMLQTDTQALRAINAGNWGTITAVDRQAGTITLGSGAPETSDYTFRLGAYAGLAAAQPFVNRFGIGQDGQRYGTPQDSRPAAAAKDSEEGVADGVAPSRGDIGASLPPAATALDCLLGDEFDEVA